MAHLSALPAITGTKPTYIADIDVDKIKILPEAQRDLNSTWVRRIADNWRPELVSVLVVSANEDGTYDAVDGQHRHAAAKIAGVPTLPCVVHTGLTVKDKAALFLELQRERKGVSPLSTYKVSITAEEPWAIAVRDVTDFEGLTVAGAPGTYSIGAIRTLQKTYELGGKVLLLRTLRSIKAAYVPTQGREAWSGDLIYGVAKFYHKNPTADHVRLEKTLQSEVPAQWAAFVAVMSRGSGGSDGRPSYLATLLARRYNKGLRNKSKLVLE